MDGRWHEYSGASLYLKTPAENVKDAESSDIPSKLRVILWGARCSFVQQTSRTAKVCSVSSLIQHLITFACCGLFPEEACAVHKMSGYDERSNLAQLRRGEIMEGGRFPIPSSPLCVLKTEL